MGPIYRSAQAPTAMLQAQLMREEIQIKGLVTSPVSEDEEVNARNQVKFNKNIKIIQ